MTKIDTLKPVTPKSHKRERHRLRKLENKEFWRTIGERLDRLEEQIRAEKAQKEE